MVLYDTKYLLLPINQSKNTTTYAQRENIIQRDTKKLFGTLSAPTDKT